jgi:hypothetical protein
MLGSFGGPCASPGRPESPRRTLERPGALRDRGEDEHGALAMGAVPLHVQRKFEQRWAARFASRVAPAAPERLPARPHDTGSQSNETFDGLDSTTDAFRHAAEDTAKGALG